MQIDFLHLLGTLMAHLKNNILNSKLKVDHSRMLDKGVAEPFSFTEYVTNLTSIYTDFIQAIAVISILEIKTRNFKHPNIMKFSEMQKLFLKS